eukprot:gene8910-16535_t
MSGETRVWSEPVQEPACSGTSRYRSQRVQEPTRFRRKSVQESAGSRASQFWSQPLQEPAAPGATSSEASRSRSQPVQEPAGSGASRFWSQPGQKPTGSDTKPTYQHLERTVTTSFGRCFRSKPSSDPTTVW